LVNACLNIGDIHATEGDSARALAACQEAVTLAEHLVERDRDNLDWQDRLCYARIRLGGADLGSGNRRDALAALGPAPGLARRQVDIDSHNATWAGYLVLVNAYLADVPSEGQAPA